jgi:hypothetical protein
MITLPKLSQIVDLYKKQMIIVSNHLSFGIGFNGYYVIAVDFILAFFY